MNPTQRTAFAGGPAERADNWLGPGRFALLLCGFIFAANPDVILGTRAFWFRDFGTFCYPLAYYHRESFWRGELPLWNPLSSCGIPFLAQWNTLVTYPGSLFYLLLPLSWALSIFCLGHVFVGGMGMYFLGSTWTGNRLGAATAGVIYTFNGMSLNALMWPAVSAAVGWMPWVLLATERSWSRGGRQVIAAAVLAAMQMLSGTPEVIVLTWLFVGVLAATQMVRHPQSTPLLLRRLATVIVLVAGLSAVQLLPFISLLIHSDRQPGVESSVWSMPGTGWANLLVPLFRFYPTVHGVYLDAEQAWTSSYYLGATGMALGIVAVVHVRDRRVWLAGSALILTLILAMGNSGRIYPWLLHSFPALGLMRYPIKFMFLAGVCQALLAGFAVAQFRVATADRRRELWRTLLIVVMGLAMAVAAILWFDRCYPAGTDYTDFWPGTVRNGLLRLAFLLAALTALHFVHPSNRFPFQKLLSVLFLSFLFADFLTHVPRQNPTLPRGAFAPGILASRRGVIPNGTRAMISSAANRFLSANPEADMLTDFIRKRGALFSDLNLLENISKVNGFYALYLREPNEIRSLVYKGAEPPPRLADFLAVSRITAPTTLTGWESRTNFLPLVTAGQRPVFADPAATLAGLTNSGFDPQREVYLPIEVEPDVHTKTPAPARTALRHFGAHRIDVAIEAPGPTLVTVAQAFYPAWRARIDGRTAPVWRANYAFQAVEVPAGNHAVVLEYVDNSFYWGCFLSVVVLVICALAFARSAKADAP